MSETRSVLLTKSPAVPGVTLSDATRTFLLTSDTEVSSAVSSLFLFLFLGRETLRKTIDELDRDSQQAQC